MILGPFRRATGSFRNSLGHSPNGEMAQIVLNIKEELTSSLYAGGSLCFDEFEVKDYSHILSDYSAPCLGKRIPL